MSNKQITILVVEPCKRPYVKTIPHTLDELQRVVGGAIEAIYPFFDNVALICNEEGKLNGLELNRALRDEDDHIYDIIAGTFFIVGLSEDDFESLSVEMIQKYSEYYARPEIFFNNDGKIVCIKDI